MEDERNNNAFLVVAVLALVAAWTASRAVTTVVAFWMTVMSPLANDQKDLNVMVSSSISKNNDNNY